MLWTVPLTLSLIRDLRRNPCLWDMSCPEFKSRSKKIQTLSLFAAKYGVSVIEMERKIQGLKGQFRREHKNVLKSKLANDSTRYTPLWFGYESLLFLRNGYEIRGMHKKSRNAIIHQASSQNPETYSVTNDNVIKLDPSYTENRSCLQPSQHILRSAPHSLKPWYRCSRSMFWTETLSLKLIKDLRRNPCLWDMSCADFFITSKRIYSMCLLASKYGVTEKEIKRKIQNLKNQFRRYHNNVLHSRHAKESKPYEPPWFAYESLLFLRDNFELRYQDKWNRDDIANSVFQLPNNDIVVKEEISDESAQTNGAMHDAVLSPALSDDSFEYTPSINRPIENEISNNRNILEYLASLQHSSINRDPYSVYGEYIANQLRHSGKPRLEITIAQHKIDEICSHLALGAFAREVYTGNNQQYTSIEDLHKSEIIEDEQIANTASNDKSNM